MGLSNRERVGRGLEELVAGLVPFVERELKARVGAYWKEELLSRMKSLESDGNGIHWDEQAVLKSMIDNWQSCFRYVLGHTERAYVSELLDVRNDWAHKKPFTSEDVYRTLDTVQRLLQSVSEGERASIVGEMKAELQRQVYAEQARNKTRYQLTIDGTPQAGLKSWREVITPHDDVASGRYMQAEFAADLAQVIKGEGSPEYREPVEFFRRTFVTAGLRDLLVGALRRLTDNGGDPVVELQTNFGGGKTHSMLALYHLFSGVSTSSLDGLEPVLKAAEVGVAPKASRAVLVGTAISPAQPSEKADGTVVRTLWGEMAWQLGGADGYAMVAASDEAGTAPGSDVLSGLFRQCSPAIVLIDEWVAYARQLVGRTDLPAGSFEAQDSFAQSLTEAAKRAPGTLVVASVPASKIEIGGENGQLALDVLKNVFERVGKPWRPATADEGFEIVRRRLFEPIEPGHHAHRDAVVNAFSKLYKDNRGDFPPECAEGTYREDMLACYPVHPELFRRLYDDWSTLDKFQRTRGVLRLLAKVIHRLWMAGDPGLLILPSSVPMDDAAVKSELTKYLPDVWEPIISQDVDGPNSTPLKLDEEVRHLGRYSACRRVARSLYIGTAPGSEGMTPGVGAERIRLACGQPGESVATFGDALRRVSDRGRYVHQDSNRYWLSTRPNLNRTADDRAKGLLREPEELYAQLVSLLEGDRSRGEFAGVHICPRDSSEVPDEAEARLVILRPETAHRKGKDSKAKENAVAILQARGGQPRLNRNTLVFLAPDEKELVKLLEATASSMAWTSILKDRVSLNLDEFQKAQAEAKQIEMNRTVELRIGATWVWALVPLQSDPAGDIEWDEIKVSGSGSLAKRTAAKLVSTEHLLPSYGGERLRMVLDRNLWTDRDHVSFEELSEWFPRYLYLPRVRNRETLSGAVRDGAGVLTPAKTFATAELYNEETKRYVGLKVGAAPLSVTNGTLVVKTPVAQAQLELEKKEAEADTKPTSPDDGDGDVIDDPVPPTDPPEPVATKPTRFFGSVRLEGLRVGRDAGKIADEVLSHLIGLPGAEVNVSLEVQIRVPDGVSDDVVRTVSENATVLGFQHASFEKE